jgi:hypothetical protein
MKTQISGSSLLSTVHPVNIVCVIGCNICHVITPPHHRHDHSVGTARGYRLHGWCSIPGRGIIFFSSPVTRHSEAHIAPYPMGTREFLPNDKVARTCN